MAADSRRARDGRFLEILGHYNPIAQPYELLVQKDRVQRWIEQGARPSEQVAALLRSTGMTLGKPSKPAKKAAAAPTPRTRSKPRKVSGRKTRAKAARATAKKTGTPRAGKGARKKAAE